MPFSEEDKVLIKNLNLYKGYGPRRLMTEFPKKNWKKGGLEKLLRKLRETGSTNRRHGSGRPKHARTEENVTSVEELVQSQEGQPQTHCSTRQIAREMRISQSSVVRIIHRDLDLKCLKRRHAQELTEANCRARLIRSKQLLRHYSDSDVDFIWFTDEKVFTVATPKNTQNDRVYVPAAMKKRDVTSVGTVTETGTETAVFWQNRTEAKPRF